MCGVWRRGWERGGERGGEKNGEEELEAHACDMGGLLRAANTLVEINTPL